MMNGNLLYAHAPCGRCVGGEKHAPAAVAASSTEAASLMTWQVLPDTRDQCDTLDLEQLRCLCPPLQGGKPRRPHGVRILRLHHDHAAILDAWCARVQTGLFHLWLR